MKRAVPIKPTVIHPSFELNLYLLMQPEPSPEVVEFVEEVDVRFVLDVLLGDDPVLEERVVVTQSVTTGSVPVDESPVLPFLPVLEESDTLVSVATDLVVSLVSPVDGEATEPPGGIPLLAIKSLISCMLLEFSAAILGSLELYSESK